MKRGMTIHMSWNDIVRKHFPNADDNYCEFILWEYTPFPVSQDAEEIERLIIKLKNNPPKGVKYENNK